MEEDWEPWLHKLACTQQRKTTRTQAAAHFFLNGLWKSMVTLFSLKPSQIQFQPQNQQKFSPGGWAVVQHYCEHGCHHTGVAKLAPCARPAVEGLLRESMVYLQQTSVQLVSVKGLRLDWTSFGAAEAKPSFPRQAQPTDRGVKVDVQR